MDDRKWYLIAIQTQQKQNKIAEILYKEKKRSNIN